MRRDYVWLLLALIPFMATGALAQDQPAGSDPWREAALPVTVDGGRLDGPGGDWLIERLATAEAVLVGEQHGVEGLAEFVAVLEVVHAPDALVLETGPWFASQLNTAQVGAALRTSPYSLAFDHDGDIALIDQYQLRTRDAVSIWGVDQELNAFHAFEWLSRVGETGAVRRTARGLYLKAVLDRGEYLRVDNQSDLDRLNALGGPGSFAEEIAETLSRSMTIYVTWRSGARSRAAAIREQYMMDRYAAERDDLADTLGAAPRTLLKMGGAHILEGVGPNGIETLGFAVGAQLRGEGAEALHLGVRGYSPEHTDYPIAEILPEGALLLIDTARVRAAIENGEQPDLTDAQRADIYGFDALVYIHPSERASKVQVSQWQGAFRQRLFTTLGLSFWPVVPLAVLVVFGIALSVWRGLSTGLVQISPIYSLTVSSGVMVVLFTVQMLLLASGAPGSAGPSSLYWTVLSPIFALFSGAHAAWHARGTGMRGSVGGLAWASLLIWLAIAMYQWNFGAMLA